jgi:flagellar hook protein FlgE
MGFSSFYAGLSGMQAYASQLNVIGNNLANVNTIGFKTARMTFQDLLYQTAIGSGQNPAQIGLGVQTAAVDSLFSQGSLQGTGVVTDLAIQGNGFFVLQDSQGARAFSRAGNFSLDKNGDLATSSGALVQGYTTRDANGNIVTSGAIGCINIPPGLTAPPRETTAFTATTNLNVSARVDDPLTAANEAETFSTTLQVFDSLGARHDLTLSFTPVDTNADGRLDQWAYQVTVAGGDVAGGTAGTPFVLSSGNLTFDAKGKLQVPSGDLAITTPAWTNGGAAQTLTWRLFDPASGESKITGYDGASATSTVNQDGYSAGTLRTLVINNDGQVDGVFTNGSTLHLARVALATFNNPNGLLKAGFNGFLEATASGSATIGAANTGGRGAIAASSLELSNVDITQELTDMITAERGYQANSRIITTTDQVIQEALNLKR